MRKLVEVWKPIMGYEGLYEVSNLGRVKSLDRTYTTKNKWGDMQYTQIGKLKKIRKNIDGYCVVQLSKNGKQKEYKVHRLMCQAFLPNPNNLLEVNHKNKKRDCNIIWVNNDSSIDDEKSNLEWCDRHTNNLNRENKKAIIQFNINGELIKKWHSAKDAAEALNTTPPNIRSCLKGKTKTACNSTWEYYNTERYLIALMNKTIKKRLPQLR